MSNINHYMCPRRWLGVLCLSGGVLLFAGPAEATQTKRRDLKPSFSFMHPEPATKTAIVEKVVADRSKYTSQDLSVIKKQIKDRNLKILQKIDKSKKQTHSLQDGTLKLGQQQGFLKQAEMEMSQLKDAKDSRYKEMLKEMADVKSYELLLYKQEGVAKYEKRTALREKAKDALFAEAIRIGVATYITSNTLMENNILIMDRVASEKRGKTEATEHLQENLKRATGTYLLVLGIAVQPFAEDINTSGKPPKGDTPSTARYSVSNILEMDSAQVEEVEKEMETGKDDLKVFIKSIRDKNAESMRTRQTIQRTHDEQEKEFDNKIAQASQKRKQAEKRLLEIMGEFLTQCHPRERALSIKERAQKCEERLRTEHASYVQAIREYHSQRMFFQEIQAPAEDVDPKMHIANQVFSTVQGMKETYGRTRVTVEKTLVENYMVQEYNKVTFDSLYRHSKDVMVYAATDDDKEYVILVALTFSLNGSYTEIEGDSSYCAKEYIVRDTVTLVDTILEFQTQLEYVDKIVIKKVPFVRTKKVPLVVKILSVGVTVALSGALGWESYTTFQQYRQLKGTLSTMTSEGYNPAVGDKYSREKERYSKGIEHIYFLGALTGVSLFSNIVILQF